MTNFPLSLFVYEHFKVNLADNYQFYITIELNVISHFTLHLAFRTRFVQLEGIALS